jgi:hypothetical protein
MGLSLSLRLFAPKDTDLTDWPRIAVVLTNLDLRKIIDDDLIAKKQNQVGGQVEEESNDSDDSEDEAKSVIEVHGSWEDENYQQ